MASDWLGNCGLLSWRIERKNTMGETALNAFAQQLVNLTLNKTRYDNWDLQWFTEGPFWRRTSMNYSRDYKQIPDYEIGDLKHGKSLQGILDEAAVLHKCLLEYKKTADLMMEMREKRVNVSFVLNEYGATVGMITLEDLIEEIVGEIRDEYDEDEEETKESSSVETQETSSEEPVEIENTTEEKVNSSEEQETKEENTDDDFLEDIDYFE